MDCTVLRWWLFGGRANNHNNVIHTVLCCVLNILVSLSNDQFLTGVYIKANIVINVIRKYLI